MSSGRVVGDASYQSDFNSLNIPSFYPEKCSAFPGGSDGEESACSVGLSLWSGSTDSKSLDYQRTNPAAAAAAKSLQSCPTLCDPIDGSPREQSLALSRNSNGRLDFPGPTQEKA